MEQVRRELTVRGIVLGVVLAMVLAAANAYLGLFAGMTVSASIPAAVVSMGIFRLLRNSSILENNIVQTAASAGESVAAGAIFTLPALLMLGFWEEFHFLQVLAITGLGGLLGVLFTIPLRRSLILEEGLQFPEGVATAEVLEAGQAGGKGLATLIRAALAGGLYKAAGVGLGLWPATVEGAGRIGQAILYGGVGLSPALIGVGYIVGFHIAVLIFLGGAMNWLVAIPILSSLTGAAEGSALEQAYGLWSSQTKYLGVGAMVVGGLWTIFQMRRSLLSGVASGLRAYRGQKGTGPVPRQERDIPMLWVLVCIVGSVVPLFLLYQFTVDRVAVSATMAVCMVVAGFIFSAVAGYLAGLVGSSNNPVSGVTIATVLFTALLLAALMGKDAVAGPGATIVIAGAVCCAAAIAGDNMQDLKTGNIVGATPWRQQVMQCVGTLSGAVVIGPVLMLLSRAYGFEGMEGAGDNALAAPQANLMASIAGGVFRGELPWNFIIIGFFVAAAIIAADEVLRHRGSRFRMPVLAVAIGIYLPFELSSAIFAGGVLNMLVARRVKGSAEGGRGLLFASGLITGEALMGIGLAAAVVGLRPAGIALPLMQLPWGAVIGAAVLAAILWRQYKAGLDRDETAAR